LAEVTQAKKNIIEKQVNDNIIEKTTPQVYQMTCLPGPLVC